MSQTSVDLVRGAYAALGEALAGGDYLGAIERFCDRHVVIRPTGLLPESTEMRGESGGVGKSREIAGASPQCLMNPHRTEPRQTR